MAPYARALPAELVRHETSGVLDNPLPPVSGVHVRPINAFRACTSEMMSSISGPPSVRFMRSTVDDAITTSPAGNNKSHAATSQCEMKVSIAPSTFCRSAGPAHAPPEIIGGRPGVVITQQHTLSSSTGHQLDAVSIHIRRTRRETSRLRSSPAGASEQAPLDEVRGVAAAVRERLLISNAPTQTCRSAIWVRVHGHAAHLMSEQPRRLRRGPLHVSQSADRHFPCGRERQATHHNHRARPQTLRPHHYLREHLRHVTGLNDVAALGRQSQYTPNVT